MTRWYKRSLPLVALALVLALAVTAAPAAELEKGAALPAFELGAGDGQSYSLDTLRGEAGLVLIVYRGVW